MPRKKKKENDDPSEQVPSSFRSRSIIAMKLQSIKDGRGISSKNAQKPTKWCPHCNCNLLIKTFKKHKSLYFIQNEWLTTDLEELPESFVNEAITGITMHIAIAIYMQLWVVYACVISYN